MVPGRLLALIVAIAVPALGAAGPAISTPASPVPAATKAAPPAARVLSFSPQGSVKAVRQVVARFSTNMVALGDPRLPDPFTITCNVPGRGRWIDTRSWAYDFAEDLPGGVTCTFQLQRGLEDLVGTPVSTPKSFRFDTGGPSVRASLPHEGAEAIDEEQAFLLRLDAPATAASIRAYAHCVVEGLAEAVPVVVIEGQERAALLAQRRQLGYAYYRILWKDGLVTDERMRDGSMKAAEQQLVAVRCQRRLPPAAQVELVWGKGIATTTGLPTNVEQRLPFRVRPDFTARVECTRTNPEAGCLPFKPIDVRFTSPVPREQALGLRLKAGTTVIEPVAVGDGPMIDAIRFKGPFPESSTVHVLLPTALADDAGRVLSNAPRFPVAVRVDEYPPLAKFPGTFGILEARAGGVLPVTLRNLDSPAAGTPAAIPARKLRIGSDPAAIADWLRRVNAAVAERGDWETDPKTGRATWKERTGSDSVFRAGDGVSNFTIPKPAGARDFEVVGVPLKATGLYVVELESRRLGRSLLGTDQPRYVATAALVTNLAVHFKWGRESSLVWVTTLDGGRPVPNAAVTVTDACEGKLRWIGTTDRDGLAHIDRSLGDEIIAGSCEYAGSQRPLMVMAQSGDDFSFTQSWWTEGISPWDFGLPVGSKYDLNLFSTVLDRSLFRPGETVSMKHYLRRHASPGVVLDAGVPGERKVVIEHDGSDQKYELAVKFDANGIAEQRWVIPAGARTGNYTVRIADAVGQLERSASFKVEDFRLPTMRADVTGPARPQVQPKQLPLDLHVSYLSGGGAGGLPVTLRTYVDPQGVRFRGYDDYTFGGNPVREGTERLGDGADDEAGFDEREGGDGETVPEPQSQPKVRVMPLTLDKSGALRVEIGDLPRVTSTSTLTAELEYPDSNGELLTQTSYIRLHPASVHVGLRREGWVGSAEQLRFRVVVLDLDGKPVPKHDVQVSLYQARDYSFRKRLIGGFYAYETTRETSRLPAECAGRTDAAGYLNCEVAPGVSGQVLMRAETRDSAGRIAGATTSAWVMGADDWWFGGTKGDRMDVLPEQREYEAGQTARLQVRMPFRKATALVTVEREGVLRGFVTTLSGKQPVVKLPLAATDAPNVFVSVLAVRGRIAKPEAGGKVDAESAVTALVDLNRPAFRLGNARLRVGWKPHRLDVAVTPDRKLYGVREQAQVQVVVKRADGTPLPAGSEVAIAAVDEALLQLSPNPSWALLDAMMGERGIEVWTATAQMQVVGKRHYGRKAVPHGGGGGHDHARRSFSTLLLWQGRVPLDANGTAKVTVPLNDSLSTFRIVAVASGGAHLFGTGSASITTTQDLILLSGLPQLVREGDRFLATFTARNTSSTTQRVTLEAGLTPSQPIEPRQVELAPGEARDLVWPVTVPVDAARLGWDVRLRKADGSTGDRLQVNQTVVAAQPVRTYQATLTQLAAPWAVPVALPKGALPGRGGIDVSVQARLADNLDGVRDYMSRYPYTCIEQNLSRSIALGSREQWDAWMGRLPAYLDGAGLLKYFASNALPGEDGLTAYVLSIADARGWPIPETSRAIMLDGLTGFVRGQIQRDSALPTADLTVRKLAAIAALARHGRAEANMLDSLQLTPSLWPTSAVLDWIDILGRVKTLPNRATRIAQARDVLRSRLTYNGTTMTFSTERNDALWWLMISTDSNAARFLLAAVDDPQWREDVPRLVRGLLGRQQRGHWNTTVANAWGTLAMERFSAKFESTPVTGKTGVALGTTRRELAWPSADAAREFSLPWPAERASLGIAHVGTGKPWALVKTNAALPLDAPVSSGLAVTRSVTAVEQKNAGRWTRGDVLRVKLQVDAQSDATWLVVDDPVPAGATILGTGLGGQSRRPTQGERSSGQAWPAFEERRFDAFRAYYRFVPKGRFMLEYTLRLDNPGTFQLPATRVEAMYAPETYAELPNAPLTIEAP